jgi:serine/threonine protein kinase
MSDSQEYAGFVAPDPADLVPLFPGYEIQGLIATGGMGAVYCAVQKSLDRTVALKILPLELSQDAAFCAGFEAEAKAMARLNHPNLIGVYDFGEVNGMLYIIMEFVPGKSIFHSADGIAIDPHEVIRLVTGICHGLAHAHEHGIIHRDIKPSNILLDLNAQPKIGDFGLARPLDRKIEEGEEIFGTPHYTAPEVVENPHAVDHRADIFSVGVLLHELLTGKLPANDPRPASLISHCDTRFDAIIRRATQPVPAARYSSATEIANELQAIARSATAHGARPTAVPRPVIPRRVYAPKKKSSSGMSSVFLLLLVGAAAAAAYWHFTKKPPVVLTVPPPVVVVPPPKSPEPVEPEEPETNPTDQATEPAPEAPSKLVAEPVPIPEVTLEPQTEASTSSPQPVAPKFDVAGFFARGRAAMKDRAKPVITGYEEKLEDNVTSLERELGRQLRKQYYDRGTAEKILSADVEGWRQAGNHLPPTFGGALASLPEAFESYTEHLKKQTALDDKFNADMAQLCATYVQGLSKQMERLKAEKDEGAVTLIQQEIDNTKESPEYFSNLMRGPASTSDR